MDHSKIDVVKLEARIDVLETALSTLLKMQVPSAHKAFCESFRTNIQSNLDVALLTTYPETYLEELHAYASHLQKRISK